MTKNIPTTTYIGTSNTPDAVQAGQQAAQMAMDLLPPDDSIAWALTFCGGRHERQAMLHGLRSQMDGVQIVGGAAVGTITSDCLGYTGYECSLAAFPASIPKPAILGVDTLSAGEAAAGRQLGQELRDITNAGDTVLIFYDSIKSAPPPVLYIGSQLMDGIYQGLVGKDLAMIGAGTVGNHQLSESYVFDGQQAKKHAVVAVVLPSAFRSHTTIMHGCMPVSSFLEITKIEGAVLYELNDRPALEVLMEMLGQSQDELTANSLSLSLTIGEKHGDPYAPYDESAYVNRLIIGANPADGSVTLFEADFKEGTKVQLMSRDNQLMVESARKRTRELLDSIGGQMPVLALYIDCAGRASAFCGSDIEEASVVQAELGPEIPLLGFYSGVEIAPLLGRSRPLDWTGVLTLITLEGADG